MSRSHRAKALQSLIDAGPSTTAGELVPPASLVTNEKKSSKKSSSGAKKLIVGAKSSSSKGKSKKQNEEPVDRVALGEEDPEDEEAVAAAGGDETMADASGWETTAPSGDSGAMQEDDDDADMLLDDSQAAARRIIQSDTTKPTPVLATGATTNTSGSGFAPISQTAQNKALLKPESRKITIPPHRMTPLKREWVNVYGPLVEVMGLMVRMNVKKRQVELKTSKHTPDQGAIQKGADFIKAFSLGFDVKDALAILRLEDLYLDSFEIKDVKTLHGDHLSRAIGRIAGQDGKTKFTIENASRTRIVLADTHIHILGSVQNIKIARDAIVSLILGSPPGKVYAHLRSVGARLKQRF
ncbi:pre-rRNA-processing protein pno1 [Naganishia friedmannii]|uniref:Pre-rRNA-processing protein pno1 n=1 Tax=Naganishia friedmannii TaxID=89922 RepID=A0ACC2VIS9_9TREE|nr:pre-rRNA-processing protein pno1 [Naganishia friedmannii]